MAVNRGGVAFWTTCVRSHGRQQPVRSHHRIIVHTGGVAFRPLSSASWALAPPNSLRYQNVRRPALSHPALPPAPSRRHDDEWVESLSMCLVVRRSDTEGLQALMEIPVFDGGRRSPRPLCFPLTIVDGSGVDDISVGAAGARAGDTDSVVRERCGSDPRPAPFVYGSPCPPLERAGRVGEGQRACGLDLPLVLPSTLCSPAERLQEAPPAGDSEEEQKLALMHERLRIELPNFFRKNHDYSMYSLDMEFINGLLNTKTRGRVLYQLSLTLWRSLCLCYYADARLEVLKLSRHVEDGTVKARWRLRGLPLHSLLLRFYLKDKSQLFRSFDAFSTFYIGHDGLIHCHRVEKVMPAQGPVLPRVTSLLAGALVALGLQEHRPALNLLPPLLSTSCNSTGSKPHLLQQHRE